MKPLYVKSTDCTAEFIFDNKKQIFKIKGSSLPENAENSFNPVIAWVEEYGKHPSSKIMIVEFMFDYFNTSSLRKILTLLETLEAIQSDDLKVFVKWYYSAGDDRIREEGEELEELCDLDFEYIENK